MSKYTTEVRFICETNAGLEHSEGYKSINQIITNSMDKVFDFEFPIFDEAYRPVLERKILKHYYTREICAETVGLWKHYLDMRLNEIMPYYNKLYESELLQFNPFYDVDLTTDRKTDGERNANGERVNTGTESNERTSQDSGSDSLSRLSEDGGTESRNIQSEDGGSESGNKSIRDGGTEGIAKTVTDSGRDTGTKTSRDGGTQGESGSDVNKNTRWDIYSDTPQGALTNVNNETYLTNARKIIDDGTGSTHSSTTTFGKTVTENDTTDYGKVETTGATTTFGKTVSETDSTTFGKTNETTEGVTFGKTNEVSETETFGKRNVTNDNGQHRNTETSEDKITTTEDYLQHVVGKSGGKSYAQLLVEYRETFLNIDMLIIEDLSDLFMQLW